MALLKIKDFDPNYRDTFGGSDIKGTSVYTESTDEKVGTVDDILVDEDGQFRYIVVDLGFWIFGKKVLLPVGRARVDQDSDRVYAIGLSKQQAEALPEYKDDMTTDYNYEERVRGVYRPASVGTTTADRDMPLEGSASLDTAGSVDPMMTSPAVDPMMSGYATEPTAAYAPDTYSYQNDPLYQMADTDQKMRLYQERLVASKTRMKTGDVAIGKRVETETERVSVPIDKERVVIERSTPTGSGAVVSSGEANFQGGEVARVEIYEETPDIRKEAFVREEVSIRKEVDHEVVNAEETIRREELDVDADGRTVEERSTTRPKDLI